MMKNIPVYKHTAAYAREHTELAAYRASNQANTACKDAIEAAIRDHYRDNRLDTAAVDQVVQQFGYDRAFHILAITVCQALRDSLLNAYESFRELEITGGDRDLTEKEEAKLAKERDALTALCEKEAAKCSS